MGLGAVRKIYSWKWVNKEETVSTYDEITRRDFIQMAGATAIALGAPAARALDSNAAANELPSSPATKTTHDLGQLKWKVAGFVPYLWSFDKHDDIHTGEAEVAPIDAPVPGSVQQALLNAGILPDWNVGLNCRQAEWVENRDWVYQTQLPDEWLREGKQLRLGCAGLDYTGKILINGQSICEFGNSFVPCAVDLKPHLKPTGNLLQIWFQPPPRWLGQFGYTSEMTEWKPRFNYTWDWVVRLVQIGIWDSVTLEVVHDAEIGSVKCVADTSSESRLGSLRLRVAATGGRSLRVAIRDGGRIVREQTVVVDRGAAEIAWDDLPVDLWWPNGMGMQKLYTVDVQLIDANGKLADAKTLRVGFRHIEWKHTEGAPENAHPYLCTVNGKPVFLFGVNWTPIRPNFADLREDDYRKRIGVYRSIGVNVLRVWGGGFPERQWLYDLCDEHGLLVWQEFPLSSSGMDNCPPRDEASIRTMAEIAATYVTRLQHHACLAVWCGGNELEDNLAGHVSANPTLTIDKQPMVMSLAEVVRQNDPGRAFLPTSPYGPSGGFTQETCGQHAHWDVHGPWNLDGPVNGHWRELWEQDDAMFHSEMGAPSASPAVMIRKYKGDLPVTPGDHTNPLWNRQPWWIDWPKFAEEKGREPASLEEFVVWSQQRQSDALVLALSAVKSRFPSCGGIILWMGHDCFPCTSNASILDYDGAPKPVALALGRIFARS
jgi:beta-mannosidase